MIWWAWARIHELVANAVSQAFWLVDQGTDPEDKETDKDGDTRMGGL